jgi:hypothetical protein
MRTSRLGRRRRPAVSATCLLVLSGLLVSSAPATAAKVPLKIRIVGNHFVNGAGHRIRLLGVNHPSLEYACVDGYGYDDGHFGK